MALDPYVLIISGSDPLGEAGLARDIQTLTELKTKTALAVSAITVQNNIEVQSLYITPAKVLLDQIEVALKSLTIRALKIGMLGSVENSIELAGVLEKISAIPIVLDPVLKASSGGDLAKENLCDVYCTYLLSKITLLTPNLEELAALSQEPQAQNAHDGVYQARLLQQRYNACNILIKDGHRKRKKTRQDDSKITDILVERNGLITQFSSSFLDGQMRGTGCLLASAIASALAQGMHLHKAITYAKNYLACKFQAHLESKECLLPPNNRG